ncbi:MAG TPA: hypothetical protein VG841_02640 [Caulobacterales bacterium]|nr:hypothetical protein [Caulobacterales bacterium]
MAAVYVGLVNLLYRLADRPPLDFLSGWAGVSVLGLLVMLLLAWPFHAFAVWRKWRLLLHYALGALVIAAIVSVGAAIGIARITPAADTPMRVGIGLACLALLGLPTFLMVVLFWFIRRPDRDSRGEAAMVFE